MSTQLTSRLGARAKALRHGFTLIELLVVMVIIGILAATFGVSFLSANETAMITRATAETRELGNAVRLFLMQTDENGNLPDLSELGLSARDRQDFSSQTVNILTGKSGDKVYFQAAQDSLIGNQICDPWGNPYYITVRQIEANAAPDPEEYEIVVPIQGRHRALEPIPQP